MLRPISNSIIPFGFKELEGIHSRTDFDLKAHEEHSGKKLRFYDPELKENYVPYVIETSIGLDRMFLAVLSASLKKNSWRTAVHRTVLKLPAILAPYKAAVLPLVKKDGLPELAQEIIEELKWDFNIQYDEKDAIGRQVQPSGCSGNTACVSLLIMILWKTAR